MPKYNIMTRAMVLGSIEAATGKEAVRKFLKHKNQAQIQILDEGSVKAVLASDIAEVLKAYRNENDLAREVLAKKIGVTRMTLYRLEEKWVQPSRKTLAKMREIGII